MGVAAHLGIELTEYDSRIRTFIPHYEEMLHAGAAAVPSDARRIVDLGTGTGALVAQCAERAPRAEVVAIDSDPAILDVARRRLPATTTFVTGSFLRAEIPRCDVIVSSFALHHVRTRSAKQRLYRRLVSALARRGRIVVVDSLPAASPPIAQQQLAEWRAHLLSTYAPREATRLLHSWAKEDVYVPLDAELALMAEAGVRGDVVWRKGAFAVVVAIK